MAKKRSFGEITGQTGPQSRPEGGEQAVHFTHRSVDQGQTVAHRGHVEKIRGSIAYQVVGWSTARFRGEFGSYPYSDFQQYVIESTYNLLRFWFLNWAIIRILLYVSALRDWWKEFEADVKPLHPDKAGGFSIIGDGTLYSGLLLGAVGLYLAANIVIEVQRGALFDLGLLMGLVILTLLLAPYAFITPIWSTHKAMERERLRQLHRLSGQYNALWNKISSGEVDPDGDRLAIY